MEKRKKKKHVIDRKKKLVLVIDGILLVALIAAAVVLAVTLSGRDGGEKQASGNAPAISGEPAAQATSAQDAPAPEAPVQSAAVAGTGEIDFAQLKSESAAVVAYIRGAGTAIDYPVVQNIDNEYYMSRDIYGKKSKSGAIYLDSRNTTELVDDQMIIYGNPMEDGSMFGSLVSYRDMAYYEAHPSLTLSTESKQYRIDVYAAHTASPAMANYPILFLTPEERASYIAAARGQSFFQTNVEIGDEDRLVCLVTCADFNAGDNACFVVHGVLTEE